MVTSLENARKSLAEFERPWNGQGEENLIILTVKAPFFLPLRHIVYILPSCDSWGKRKKAKPPVDF